MTVKGMTRKQLITLLEKNVTNDNACITEGDVDKMFADCGDTYDVTIKNWDIMYKLVEENELWSVLRPFLPRVGDTMKGYRDEPKKTDSTEY